MAILNDFLTDIADSIRARKGTTEPINAQDFATEISNLGAKYDVISITENGIHDVEDYKNVDVNVISEADILLKGVIEGTLTDIEIPEGTTNIKPYTFYKCPNLISVVIPEGVTEIGSNSLGDCPKLSNVTLPNSLRKIGATAFYNCLKLSNLTLPEGLEVIETQAFHQCPLIKVVHLPSTLKTLNNAFTTYAQTVYINKGLEPSENSFNNFDYNAGTIYINATLDEYINSKLCYLPKLRARMYLKDSNGEYYIPEVINVPNVELRAGMFMGFSCKEIKLDENISILPNKVISYTSIEKLVIPKNVISLTGYCCMQNTKLKELIIPENVKTMESGCFNGCGSSSDKLTVTIKATTPPTLNGSQHFTAGNLNKIFVPKGTSSTYKSVSGWSTYASYIVEPNTINVHIPSSILNNESYSYSIDNGETWNVFVNTSLTLNDIASVYFKNTDSNTTIKIGTTSGGSDIGTIANAELHHPTTLDENIYLTIA